jgi:uncharacterized protein (DUF3084 family)
VLTVNGKAEVIVQEAQTFQNMINRLERLEEELKTLKLESLRREIAIGIEQLDSGQYIEHDEESLSAFFEDIKARGRKRLEESNAP